MSEIRKTHGRYIFPDFLAKLMSKVSQRTQMESELMSLAVILIGLTIMAVFTVFFTQLSLFIKIMTAVNMIAAFVFLSSRLTTSYQQYKSYLQIMGLLNSEGKNDTNKELEKNSNNIHNPIHN